MRHASMRCAPLQPTAAAAASPSRDAGRLLFEAKYVGSLGVTHEVAQSRELRDHALCKIKAAVHSTEPAEYFSFGAAAERRHPTNHQAHAAATVPAQQRRDAGR